MAVRNGEMSEISCNIQHRTVYLKILSDSARHRDSSCDTVCVCLCMYEYIWI